MFARIQHIDGSLEPPVAIDNRVLQEALASGRGVGSSFFLDPDGPFVTVIDHVFADDGALEYVLLGAVLEPRTYSATGHSAYVRNAHEMRMGSAQYGTLVVDDEPLDVGGSVDQASPLWSPDGRYLAVTVLHSWKDHPVMQAVLVDADTRTTAASSEARPGADTPREFIGRALRFDHIRAVSDGPYGVSEFLRF